MGCGIAKGLNTKLIVYGFDFAARDIVNTLVFVVLNDLHIICNITPAECLYGEDFMKYVSTNRLSFEHVLCKVITKICFIVGVFSLFDKKT